MSRRLFAAAVVGALATLSVPTLATGPAAAGGFCHKPVTSADGVAVDIAAVCFTPTALHVAAGKAVTWTNNDAVEHVILGSNGSWGAFDQLQPGSSVTYRFAKPGIYPYACYLHPAMVGVVVVGGSKAQAAAGAVAEPVLAAASPQPSGTDAVAPQPAAGSHAPWRWIAIAALALLVVVSGLLVANRRKLLSAGPAI